MYIIIRWLIYAGALLLVTRLVPGVFVESFYTALIVALVLGLLNALVRPILIFLTLPITLLSLGLFTFVINALLFWFAASILEGFTVTGFGPAFWGALFMWAVAWLTNALLREDVSRHSI